jgi:hypothetical protein
VTLASCGCLMTLSRELTPLKMHVPDMLRDDVDVLVGNDRVLVIQGFRRPSPQDLLEMLHRAPRPLNRNTLVQLGTGR